MRDGPLQEDLVGPGPDGPFEPRGACGRSPAAPTESAASSDDHELLHRALGRLDHGDREVLLLSRLQELSFAEVAGILECSVGAARVRISHRAPSEHSGTTISELQKENPT